MPSPALEQREVRSTTPLVPALWVPRRVSSALGSLSLSLPPVINLFQRKEKRWLLKHKPPGQVSLHQTPR